MFLIVVIAIVVLVVLFKKGVFRKPAQCRCCGKTLKGTEQQIFGEDDPFVLCDECADRIPIDAHLYAKEHWKYEDYAEFIEWDNETKEERSHFNPDIEYGRGTCLFIDTERLLLGIGSDKEMAFVFRFKDIKTYELNFKPEEIKEGILGEKVKGNEFVAIELGVPDLYFEEVLERGVKLKLKKKGFINTKYEYDFSESFSELIRDFTICVYLELTEQGILDESSINISEIEKALALFMFDSMDDVTQESLKKQRNALIKAFHPDNNETNEAYSQKINAAYDLLSRMAG